MTLAIGLVLVLGLGLALLTGTVLATSSAGGAVNETASSVDTVDETGPTVESVVVYGTSNMEVVFSEPVTTESVEVIEVTRGLEDDQNVITPGRRDVESDRRFLYDIGSEAVHPVEPVTVDFGTVEARRGHTNDVGSVSATVTSATVNPREGHDSPDDSQRVERGELLAVVTDDVGGSVEVDAVGDSNVSPTTLDLGNGSVTTFDTNDVDDGATLEFSFAGNETQYAYVGTYFNVRTTPTELTVNDRIRVSLFGLDRGAAYPIAFVDEDGEALEETLGYVPRAERSPPDAQFDPPGPGNYTVRVANPVTRTTEITNLSVEYVGPELVSSPSEAFGTISLRFTEPLAMESTGNITLWIDGEPDENYTLEYDGSDDRLDIGTDREFGTDVDVRVDIDATAAETGTTNRIRNESVAVCAQTAPPIVGDGSYPGDLDDDGLYEDVDGDGTLTTRDIIALFEHLEDDAIQNNVCNFDFSGDGRATVSDVIALISGE